MSIGEGTPQPETRLALRERLLEFNFAIINALDRAQVPTEIPPRNEHTLPGRSAFFYNQHGEITSIGFNRVRLLAEDAVDLRIRRVVSPGSPGQVEVINDELYAYSLSADKSFYVQGLRGYLDGQRLVDDFTRTFGEVISSNPEQVEELMDLDDEALADVEGPVASSLRESRRFFAGLSRDDIVLNDDRLNIAMEALEALRPETEIGYDPTL